MACTSIDFRSGPVNSVIRGLEFPPHAKGPQSHNCSTRASGPRIWLEDGTTQYWYA